jgi:hypothetical protein
MKRQVVLAKKEVPVSEVDASTYFYSFKFEPYSKVSPYQAPKGVYILMCDFRFFNWHFQLINNPPSFGGSCYYSRTPEETIEMAVADGMAVYQYGSFKELIDDLRIDNTAPHTTTFTGVK